MNTYVLRLNPEANLLDQWDFGIVRDFVGEPQEVKQLPNTERAIVCIAGRMHKDYEKQVSSQLANVNRVVLFVCGDEEADFDLSQIDHPNIDIWVQNPTPGKHDNYHRIGTGYPQHMRKHLPETIEKTRTMVFAGQMTHKRRRELVDIVESMTLNDETIRCLPSMGFTQGIEPKDYYTLMCEAKIAPAPSGAVVPDSFRLFEALECMAIPIGDEVSPRDYYPGYWDYLFGEITPFPKITNWDRLFGLTDELLADYPRNMHQITAWYIQWKRRTRQKIEAQYES